MYFSLFVPSFKGLGDWSTAHFSKESEHLLLTYETSEDCPSGGGKVSSSIKLMCDSLAIASVTADDGLAVIEGFTSIVLNTVQSC